MKNLFVLILIFILYSCGTVAKLKKKEIIKSDSISISKLDSTNTTKTITLTKVTESLDTLFQPKSDSATTESKLIDLQNGDTTTTTTGTIEIKNFIDKKSGKLKTQVKTKPAPIIAKFNKTTTVNKTEDKITHVKKENKIIVDKKETFTEKSVQRSGSGIKTGVIITLSILLILIILYLITRKKLKEISKYFP